MSTKAKRGDLAVIEKRTSYVTTSEGYHETTQYEVGVVTNITREGIAKTVKLRRDSEGTPLDRIIRVQRTFIVPKDEIDVTAATEAAWSNQWPSGHEGMPFDSLDSVRDTLKPFLVKERAT